jgi:hypothetical protein
MGDVRTISYLESKECKSKGAVEGYASAGSLGGGKSERDMRVLAQNDVRKQAFNIGANAVRFTSSTSELDYVMTFGKVKNFTQFANVYLCQEV